MRSRWSDQEHDATVAQYLDAGLPRDVAVRVYTTRILGQDPALVLHGGGNTSVKTALPDADGTPVDVLCVKGSGWDMGTIEPAGLPAVRLRELQALARLPALTDERMVMLQRRLLMDPSAPNPSIEAILHAIVPHRHVDHTHANAIVGLTNQPHGEDMVRELFPDCLVVPYVMPGFDLALACAAVLRDSPAGGDGMILLKHGIFTYSDDPRASYEAMIGMVDRAEQRLARGRARPFAVKSPPAEVPPVAAIAPILRGVLAQPTEVEGRPRRLVLAHRSSPRILDLCNTPEAPDLVARGNATPEHVIRIKRAGLALPAPTGDLSAFKMEVDAAVARYEVEYRAYFARNNARVGGGRTMLDPKPRVFYIGGVGLFAAGATRKDAEAAADVAEATVDVITAAEGIERWEPLSEADLFDIEYWSLEQAKLTKNAEKPMTRQVCVVTGAAGGLGLSIAEAFRAEGAEVALLDISEGPLRDAARRLGGLAVPCDLTDPIAVDAAMAVVVETYGGVDIVVSNAGAAFQGRMADVADDVLARAFAINFYAHHYVARAAVRVMRWQGTGGALLFNVSKQAVNPGADFGPYGVSKSALMALMRQYAIEHGADGITSNAVNADRVRTGLMTDAMVAERSRARGVSPEAYMRGNLVGREIAGADVATAFVHLARARASTGAVLTVDGGNVAAMMR